jgi:hypothetical protein
MRDGLFEVLTKGDKIVSNRPRNSPSVFRSLIDELMTIFISHSSDAFHPHQSVLSYYQSGAQISDKSDKPGEYTSRKES